MVKILQPFAVTVDWVVAIYPRVYWITDWLPFSTASRFRAVY